MVKQLIAVTISLLIKNAQEVIHYVRVIFDFTMLTQYPLHNNEIFFYMEHALYKLNITKIAFENQYPINVKLFQLTLNSLKFHAITYFV